MARRAGGKAAKRRRRSERISTNASADASKSVLPVAGSVRFRRRERMQGNRPRASSLRASGVRAIQEQCAGDATRRGDRAGGYAGVPAVFLQHTRVSSGGLTREQENLEVRGGIGIANQSVSIVSSQGSTTSNSSYPSWITQPTIVATDHGRNTSPVILHPLQPFPANFFVTHGTSSPSSTSYH
jgi:hypothetical protein